MPNYARPVAQKPQNWLAGLRNLSTANASGGTEYIYEYPKGSPGSGGEAARGVPIAILGNIAHGPSGESTGLSGWGIAVYHEGKWVQVTGGGGGGGGGVTTASKPLAITGVNVELEALGVTGAYIAEGTITTSKYANVSITGEKIASATIAAAKLKEGELTRPYLKVEGVGAAGKVLGYTASGSGLEWVAGGGGSYTAGTGLELSGSEFKVKAEGITTALLAAAAVTTIKIENEAVTKLKLSAEVQTKLGEIKSYTAGEGLELSGAAFKVKAASLTNAMVKAAAGIEDSKLALTTVVKLAGAQSISGRKEFNPTSGPAIELYTEERTGLSTTNVLRAPLNMTMVAGALLRMKFITGEVKYEGAPSAEGSTQLFVSAVRLVALGSFAMTPAIALNSRPELEPAEETTSTGWHPIAVGSKPVLLGGSGTGSGQVSTVRSGLTFTTGAGWTISTYRGLLMEDAIGASGTLTTSVAVDVEDLKKATTNLSLRSVGTSVEMRHVGNVKIGANEAATYTMDVAGNIAANKAGSGFRVKEGSNAKMGTAKLTAGKVAVANTSVTASSKIIVFCIKLGTVTVISGYTTTITAAKEFVIETGVVTDTSEVGYIIFEPA